MSAKIDRTADSRQLYRLGPGASDSDGAVAKFFDQLFKIERDHHLVFDNENVGRNLSGKLSSGLIDQILQPFLIDVENRSRVLFENPSTEISGMPVGHRGNLAEMAFRRARLTARSAPVFTWTEFQILEKYLVQCNSGMFRQRLFDQDLQGGGT